MSSRVTKTFYEDIFRSIAAVEDFVSGMTFEEYKASLLVRSAVERQLQILAEAAFRLRDDAERLCPEIDWRAIQGLGNFLRHEYDFVSDQIIWDSLGRELPPLKAAVLKALDQLG